MKIEGAAVSLSAHSQHTAERTLETRLTAGFVREGDTFNEASLVSREEVRAASRELMATYEDPRKQLRANAIASNTSLSFTQLTASATATDEGLPVTLSEEDKLKLEVIKRLFEGITGKKLEVRMFAQASASEQKGEQTALSLSNGLNVETAEPANRLRFGLDYSAVATTKTTDKVNFDAQGKVLTADGRALEININLALSRETSRSETLNMRLGAALQDPLVINFSGQSAELTSDTWQFDIDSDGDQESLYQLKAHSGYIALDKNQNGIIDDGGELFGATSGDGFADLRQYDQDQNGFIDEGDAIFQHLKIMVQGSNNSQQLFTLAEKNIGALYLGSQATPWDLAAGEQDQLAGQLRSTGFFLTEEGSAGTLQQIDLVV